MFKRQIRDSLLKAVQTFPAVVLTGPRQSGKTTLLKKLFPEYTYVNLEFPDQLLRVQEDPRSFFHNNEKGWIVDEVQHFPQLMSYIQGFIDERNISGRFILSGSQNFLLLEKVSQSLAGRAAIFELLPLSYGEYVTHSEMPSLSLWEFLFYGGYPRPYQEHIEHGLWYSSYIRTYLERDVRSIINVADLSKFQLFMKLCAGFHGQLLNLSALAGSCGVSQTTITKWLSILEASYIIYRLPPHYKNFMKRLVKTPKLYFYDSSIVCHLLGIESVEHLKIHASRGVIFEGFVLSEVMKWYFAVGKRPQFYFWRDHRGLEVDLVIEKGETFCAVEMKSSSTFNSEFVSNLMSWQQVSKTKPCHSYLIYGGDEEFTYKSMLVLPWDQFLGKIV